MALTNGSIHYFLAVMTLSSAIELAFGLADWTSFKSVTIGIDRNVTLSFLHERDVERRTITMSTNTIGSYSTTKTTVNFDIPVTVNVTLIHVLTWHREKTNRTDGFGWVVKQQGGPPTFLWTKTMDNYEWVNKTSVECPYLTVLDVQTAEWSENQKALQVNKTITFDTNKIAFRLNNIPPYKWCGIRIELIATPLVANYCQIKEKLYCNESRQCVNTSAWCDGNYDCDRGEDELNCEFALRANYCQNGGLYCNESMQCVKTSSWCDGKNDCDRGEDEVNCVSTRPLLVFALAVPISAIIFATTFFVIRYYYKRNRNAPSSQEPPLDCCSIFQRLQSKKKENHIYDYPKFSEDTFPLNTQCSPVSDSFSERTLHMSPKDFTETYESTGLYSRVITVTSAT